MSDPPVELADLEQDRSRLYGDLSRVGDFRHGALHYKYAKPFLEAGLPIFIDKPIACSISHAKKIIALAKRHHAPLMSASATRFGPRIECATNCRSGNRTADPNHGRGPRPDKRGSVEASSGPDTRSGYVL